MSNHLLKHKIIHLFLITIFVQIASSANSSGSNLRSNNKEPNNRQLDTIFNEKINVLALGGSVTWGAGLSSRDLAYPSLIGKGGPYNVRNLAVRASDAYYPSLCIESLVNGDTTEYDVIILEYSLNGFSGFPILVKRLQYRYPNAALIYMHLYSLITVCNRYNDKPWSWKKENYFTPRPAVERLMDSIGAYTYTFPKPDRAEDAAQYFAKDGHHISAKGHQLIANELLHLLRQTSFEEKSGRKIDHINWGEGDQCENWFQTGKIHGKVVIDFKNGDMRSMLDDTGAENGKCSIEFFKPGQINIYNRFTYGVPLYIFYMSASEVYPITEIKFNDEVTKVDPHRAAHHVIEGIAVGWAKPGRNTIFVSPDPDSKEPFRIIGTALFGFSHNMGLPSIKAHNVVGNRLDDKFSPKSNFHVYYP